MSGRYSLHDLAEQILEIEDDANARKAILYRCVESDRRLALKVYVSDLRKRRARGDDAQLSTHTALEYSGAGRGIIGVDNAGESDIRARAAPSPEGISGEAADA